MVFVGSCQFTPEPQIPASFMAYNLPGRMDSFRNFPLKKTVWTIV